MMQVECQIGPSVYHCNVRLYFVQLFYVPFSAVVPIFEFFFWYRFFALAAVAPLCIAAPSLQYHLQWSDEE